jgi:hypothetical protein
MAIDEKVAKNMLRAIRGLAREITDRALDELHEVTGGAYHQNTFTIIRASAESVLIDYLLGQFDPVGDYHDDDD